MNTIKRVLNDDPDFLFLVKELNAFLAITDGDEHAFYDQYNQLHDIQHILVAYKGDVPVGCGALKAYDRDTYEIKRMYTSTKSRGQGIAKGILAELENWARALGGKRCTLETGIRQTAAVALYKSSGYHICPNYGQYAGLENSICFSKDL